jgi:hypothetical protein
VSDLIVSRLTGGLGNQLFQYAAACGIANASGARVALDLSDFDGAGPAPRSYALGRFDLGVPSLRNTSFDAEFRTASIPVSPALKQFTQLDSLRLPVYRENNYEFEPDIKSLRGRAYLFGFWQSWKYFAEISSTLRSRLLLPPRSDRFPGVLHGKPDRVPIAVHVRRGDYLTAANVDAFGVCEIPYYRAAMAYIRDRVEAPDFLLFTDDPAWCRQNLCGSDITVVSSENSDAVDDLALMAGCRHFILANSSLGWWGAWLGAADRSIVIAPIPWFNRSPQGFDLIPPSWVRLNRASGSEWTSEQNRATAANVSVVVLARSEPHLLRRAVESVRAQKITNLEIIIAPDAQAPGLIDAAQRIATEDARTHVALAASAGVGSALNAALAIARKEWIAFLDDCDVWLPDKLTIELETAYLTGADVVHCRTIPVAGRFDTPPTYPPPGRPDCSLEDLIQAGHFVRGISHILVRRKVLERTGPFEGSWRPDRDCEQLRRMLWQSRAVKLWTRLVRSPIPYLAPIARQQSFDAGI